MELLTERLRLRRWVPADLAPFAVLNADPAVMAHFPDQLTRAESDAMVERIEAGFEEHGFGLWAVEELCSGTFCGFTGLSVPRFEAPFMPAVEVGWRLARPFWGRGYATEAGRAAIDLGWSAGLSEIVSFTTAGNVRSRAVMERLGMTYDPADDFDHPRVPDGSPLRGHVLYRLSGTSGT